MAGILDILSLKIGSSGDTWDPLRRLPGKAICKSKADGEEIALNVVWRLPPKLKTMTEPSEPDFDKKIKQHLEQTTRHKVL